MKTKTLTVQVLDGEKVLYSTGYVVDHGQEGGLVRLLDATLDQDPAESNERGGTRIINNTSISLPRLLTLYKAEIDSIHKPEVIESIVFDSCKITIWGVDKILLEKEDV